MRLDSLKSPQSKLEGIQFECSRCTGCKLHLNRKISISGVGHADANIVMVVDRTSVQTAVNGNLFAGREGSILNHLIRLSELDTSKLWVTPCVACPTEKSVPGARPKEVFGAPKPASIRGCIPRLHKEISVIDPNMIVAMGPSSVAALRGDYTFTASKGRVVEASIIGEVVDYRLPMMVVDGVMTLLRSAQNPGKIWNKNLADIRLAEQISKQLNRSEKND